MKKEYKSATVLTEGDTRLSRKKRKALAVRISRELKKHPDRMRQLSVGEVFRSISGENSVITFAKNGTKKTGRVAAFAHLIPAKDESGNYEEDAIEVGAVITFGEKSNGYAKNTVYEAINLAKWRGAVVVRALAHVDNVPANKLMEKFTEEPAKVRKSNYVTETDGTPAKMNEYILWSI